MNDVNVSLTFPLSTVTIVLIILKAMQLIDLSWVWVFSPLWIPVAIVIGFIVIAIVISLIAIVYDKIASMF